MIAKLAKSTAHFFVEREIVNSKDEEVYAYGMELLFSTLLNMFIAVIIGIITSSLFEMTIFLTVFILARQCIGGYHAETHLGCMSIFIVVLLTFVTIVKQLSEAFIIPVSIISAVLSFILILLFAPVEHPNKPLNSSEKNVLRRKAIILFGVFLLIILVILIFFVFRRYAICISLGGFTSAVAMVCQKIKNCHNSSH
ncbi:MAG: accessory gene regulator B family protein [Oscillospiraceae bacterium]|nr:accessory gene regulator B family protein [Oscillospiraceae bacterium]